MSRNYLASFFRSLPSASYCLKSKDHKFGMQVCRRNAMKRPRSVLPYVAGNFHFVYKNCAQLNDNKRDMDDLNDVLFSHVFFTGTGVQWNLLFCTIFWSREEYVCPICLEEVAAPRMTQCGHIFCCDCLNQFFKVCEKHHACPVCSEVIIKGECIRCVLKRPQPTRFVKMQRRGMANVVTRFGHNVAALPKPSDPEFGYTRFSFADQQFIADVFKAELESLERRKAEYVEWQVEGKTEFLEAAEQAIAKDVVKLDDTEFVLGDDGEPVVFYQAEDGSLTFLDPLTVDMLMEEFGSLDKGPDVIEADVLSTRHVCVDESNCDSFAEFTHLPLGAETLMVFLDLSKVCGETVMRNWAYRIKLMLKSEQRKQATPKQPKRVITKKDFQTFRPTREEPDPPMKWDLESFPLLSPDKPAAPVKKKASYSVEVTEEYPALSDAPARPRAHRPFYVPEQEEKPQTEEYPSLSGKPEVQVQQPKKKSPWANLKL